MTRTIELRARIPADRRLVVRVPDDMPTGDARVVVETSAEAKGCTLADLAKSEYIGMWRDREDVQDSHEFARALREQAWSRSRS